MNIFKLDNVKECRKVSFNYNGSYGCYEGSTPHTNPKLEYKEKTYTFFPASELTSRNSANFFTEDDIDLLITLRDELNIEAFPFMKKDGTVTYLFLNKNWLFDVAKRLLILLEDAKMFNIVGSTLYIDGVEFDYRSKCSFGMCDYGEYSYGIIEVDMHKAQPLFLSLDINSGCKLSYFKDYLTLLPLSEYEGRVYFDVCPRVNDELLSTYSTELSSMPINEVVKYEVFDIPEDNVKVVEFIVKRIFWIDDLYVI